VADILVAEIMLCDTEDGWEGSGRRYQSKDKDGRNNSPGLGKSWVLWGEKDGGRREKAMSAADEEEREKS
jgi:hypothetical protein